MHADYNDKVVIYVPSYNRPNYKVHKIIDVPYFVVTEDDYASQTPRPPLEKILHYPGIGGLSPKCNWIVEYHRKHFPDKYLFRIDDDITGFQKAETVNNKLKWNKKLCLSEVLNEMIEVMEETNAPLVSNHFTYAPSGGYSNTIGIFATVLMNTTVKTSNYVNERIFLEDYLFAMDTAIETGILPKKLMYIKYLTDLTVKSSIIRNSSHFNDSVENTKKAIDSKYPGLIKATPDNMYPLGINTREFYKKLKSGFYKKPLFEFGNCKTENKI